MENGPENKYTRSNYEENGGNLESGNPVYAMLYENYDSLKKTEERYAKKEQEEQKALKLAYTDRQTKCYNRNYYEKMVVDIDYEKHNNNIIMIVVDINDLSLVNNKMGYAAGDKLIDNMVRQLKSQLETSPVAQKIEGNEIDKGNTIIARVGGDEFIIMRLKTEEERNDNNFEVNFENDINKRIYNNKPRNLNFAWGFTTLNKDFDEDLNGTKDRAGMLMHQQKRAIKAGNN